MLVGLLARLMRVPLLPVVSLVLQLGQARHLVLLHRWPDP